MIILTNAVQTMLWTTLLNSIREPKIQHQGNYIQVLSFLKTFSEKLNIDVLDGLQKKSYDYYYISLQIFHQILQLDVTVCHNLYGSCKTF